MTICVSSIDQTDDVLEVLDQINLSFFIFFAQRNSSLQTLQEGYN